MSKFVKSIFGNISAAGKYFMEGSVEALSEEDAAHVEISTMIDMGYLKSFDSRIEAESFKFKTRAERFLSGERIEKPALEPVKAPMQEEVKTKTETAPAKADNKNEQKQMPNKVDGATKE